MNVSEELAVERLRDVIERIYVDFDGKKGHFLGLGYRSPLDVASADWAERTGHSVETLRAVVTNQRLCEAAKRPLDPDLASASQDWQREVQTWREMAGYEDPPYFVSQERRRFPFKKRLVELISERLGALDFERTEVFSERNEVAAVGFFSNALDQEITLSF